jgi:hypothetical protein
MVITDKMWWASVVLGAIAKTQSRNFGILVRTYPSPVKNILKRLNKSQHFKGLFFFCLHTSLFLYEDEGRFILQNVIIF